MGSLARYLGFDPETAPWLREATAGEPFSFAILTLDQYGNALDTRDLAVYMEPEMLPPLLEGKWSLEADGPKTVFTIEPQESIPHDITVRLYDEAGNERTAISTQLRVGLSGASPPPGRIRASEASLLLRVVGERSEPAVLDSSSNF